MKLNWKWNNSVITNNIALILSTKQVKEWKLTILQYSIWFLINILANYKKRKNKCILVFIFLIQFTISLCVIDFHRHRHRHTHAETFFFNIEIFVFFKKIIIDHWFYNSKILKMVKAVTINSKISVLRKKERKKSKLSNKFLNYILVVIKNLFAQFIFNIV